MKDQNNLEEFSFPEKPKLEEKSSSNIKSFLSLVLYILSFYFFFEKDVKSISIFVVSIFIHELGHFIAMKIFHYQDVRMFFIPFIGAFVKGEKEEISQRQNSIILLAGPLPGIIIGFFLLAVGFIYSKNDLSLAGLIFLFLNLFNLIPFSPFDGGRLIETIFFNKKEFLQIFFLAISSIGVAIIAILTESYILLIFPFLLIFQVLNLFKFSKIRSALEAREVTFNKPFQALTDREYWLIRDQVISNFDSFKEIKVGNYEISKNENQIIDMVKLILTDRIILDLTWIGKFIIVSIWCFFFLLPLGTFTYLYSNQVAKEEQVIEQCMRFNSAKASLNPDLYKEYCQCTSNFITPFLEEPTTAEESKAFIKILLDPSLHQKCNDELEKKISTRKIK
jgi:stage IV sporulation protein FB